MTTRARAARSVDAVRTEAKDQAQHPLLALGSTVGNAGIGELLGLGLVGRPGDAWERAADGAPEPPPAQRRTLSPLAGGRPLEPGLRERMEQRLGEPLDGVRIHDGPVANSIARALSARAFASGLDIGFRPGAFAPGTAAGERLLEHELAHVGQQRRGAPPLQRQVADDAPAPQLVDVESLDSAQLLVELGRVDAWLRSHSEVLTEHAVWADYQTRLQHERGRRIVGGHIWLIEEESTDAPLYALVPRSATELVVVQVDRASAAALPASLGSTQLLSAAQFGRMRKRSGIETVAAGAIASAPAAGGARTPFTRASMDVFAQEWNNPQHLRTGLPGAIGEASLRTRTPVGGYGLLPMDDLNARTGPSGQAGNYPVFDWRSRLFDQLVSVKASSQATQGGRVGYYSGGAHDVSYADPGRQALFDWTATDLFPGDPAARASALEQAVVAVNEDDVGALRNALQRWAVADPNDFRLDIDRVLAQEPLQVMTRPAPGAPPQLRPYSSLAALESAAASGSVDQPAFAEALGSVVGEKVVGHGTSTVEIQRMLAARARFGLGTAGVSGDQLRGIVTDEWLAAELRGGGVRGNIAASGGAVATGSVIGFAIGTAGEILTIVLDDKGHPHAVRELGAHGAAGLVSGGVGAGVQQVTTGLVNEALLPASGSLAATGGGRAIASRLVGGTLGGTVAAPIFVMGTMALDDQPHEASEYAGKGTRAAVGGAAGGLGGAMLVGAIWGSEVPIAGNIVGAIVGAGVYYVVDRGVGAEIEGWVEEKLHPSVMEGYKP